MKHISRRNFWIASAIIVINAFFVLYTRYQFREHTADTSAGMTKCSNGYGGGISVLNKNQKHFVTMIQKQMFTLNDQGYIPFPDTIKRVWIDVGSHADTFLGESLAMNTNYWPNRSKMSLKDELIASHDLYVIAIDPNINFYEPLSKIPRVIPITAAIFPIEGTQVFYEYAGDGCSSLLEPNSKIDASLSRYEWFQPCTKVKKITGVSTLRLETVLSVIDPRLNVELLKVDAQGVDLDAVKSGGKQLKRISKIIIEVQADQSNNKTSNMLYTNSNTANDVRKWMSENGFLYDEKQSIVENKAIEEYNYVFNNQNIKT